MHRCRLTEIFWTNTCAAQSASMSKLWEDGKPRHNAKDGKVVKPDNWEDPKPKIKAYIDGLIEKEIPDERVLFYKALFDTRHEINKLKKEVAEINTPAT